MCFGERHRIGICCRIASANPIFPKNKIKTAIPPNGVTARCVSRRINRSSDNRAVISRGTGLSVAFVPIPLLSQILGGNLTLNFGFQDYVLFFLHLESRRVSVAGITRHPDQEWDGTDRPQCNPGDLGLSSSLSLCPARSRHEVLCFI